MPDHQHAHDAPRSPDETTAFWDARYAERERIWSGRPNAALVDAARDLTPGRALDLGCGEGGDSVWLAEQGWNVTGVDVAAGAVARGRDAADARGVGGRVRWVVTDLAAWRPDEEYDLVSACFLHSPVAFPRTAVLHRAAGAVVPGGHLLVVGHAAPPPWSTDHDHWHDRPDHEAAALLSPDEQLAALALGDAWETVVCEVRPRDAVGPEGQAAHLDDSVVLLRRR
ncbi:SAM-dependent methyltransferase [Luteimicrobium sp. DT211]|uniref:SAM-dependent methyltransferase n=1 Tax=Luteimicrobium sp. DT211 TaxID=3393412 RepID=UPI003CF393CF